MPNIICGICSKPFYVKPYHLKKGWGKYCSIECRTKAQFTGKRMYCFVCKKEVYRQQKELEKSKSGNYFCSKRCQTIWRNKYLFSDENHANWINSEASYRERIKRSSKEKVCMLCQTKDIRVLAVHHLDRNRKNNKIENLIWLCHNCHYLVHHFNNERKKLESMVAVVQK